MRRRLPLLAGVSLAGALLVLSGGATAHAGGWAVTVLDATPDRFESGVPSTIGYTILQHGKTPIAVESTGIEISEPTSGRRLRFAGTPEGPAGHYVAEIAFPFEGSWDWEVDQGGFPSQSLGRVQVFPVGAATTRPPAPGPMTMVKGAVLAAFGLSLGALLVQVALGLGRRREEAAGAI